MKKEAKEIIRPVASECGVSEEELDALINEVSHGPFIREPMTQEKIKKHQSVWYNKLPIKYAGTVIGPMRLDKKIIETI